jgi:hypothetical protein
MYMLEEIVDGLIWASTLSSRVVLEDHREDDANAERRYSERTGKHTSKMVSVAL